MHKSCTLKCNDGAFNKNSKGPNGLNADILLKTIKSSKVHRALGTRKPLTMQRTTK